MLKVSSTGMTVSSAATKLEDRRTMATRLEDRRTKVAMATKLEDRRTKVAILLFSTRKIVAITTKNTFPTAAVI